MLNMAQLWKLPTILLLNNKWAIGMAHIQTILKYGEKPPPLACMERKLTEWMY